MPSSVGDSPLWAFSVLALDLLVLYGLTVAEDFNG